MSRIAGGYQTLCIFQRLIAHNGSQRVILLSATTGGTAGCEDSPEQSGGIRVVLDSFSRESNLTRF